jgi:hypothetical protein
MNKYNRRSRPNLRHVCEFWIPSDVADESGELMQEFALHYKGPFSMETPKTPIEITDAGRVQLEQRFTLKGQWCKPVSIVSSGMFCVIPSLQKVYAVNGNATDPWGDRKKIEIQIVDNVARPVTLQLLPSLI